MQKEKLPHWSSDQVLFEVSEGDIQVHAAIGYILRELERDDRYFLMFRVQKIDSAYKDKKTETVRFDVYFESWDSLEYWVRMIPSFIAPFLFIKDENMLLDSIQKAKRQQDMKKIVEFFLAHVPRLREGIEYARFIPDVEEGTIPKLH